MGEHLFFFKCISTSSSAGNDDDDAVVEVDSRRHLSVRRSDKSSRRTTVAQVALAYVAEVEKAPCPPGSSKIQKKTYCNMKMTTTWMQCCLSWTFRILGHAVLLTAMSRKTDVGAILLGSADVKDNERSNCHVMESLYFHHTFLLVSFIRSKQKVYTFLKAGENMVRTSPCPPAGVSCRGGRKSEQFCCEGPM